MHSPPSIVKKATNGAPEASTFNSRAAAVDTFHAIKLQLEVTCCTVLSNW